MAQAVHNLRKAFWPHPRFPGYSRDLLNSVHSATAFATCVFYCNPPFALVIVQHAHLHFPLSMSNRPWKSCRFNICRHWKKKNKHKVTILFFLTLASLPCFPALRKSPACRTTLPMRPSSTGQDVALSRRRNGFDSRRARHSLPNSVLCVFNCARTRVETALTHPGSQGVQAAFRTSGAISRHPARMRNSLRAQ